MIILPNKERFIQETFIEFSFNKSDDYLPDFKLFEKLNSTDQYYLAQYYNWDDGVEILKWIIESKKCDKGTASLIFWTSEPDYYFEKAENEISGYDEKETFLLLKRIIEKFNNNEFKKSNLKYDPTNRVTKIDWNNQNSEWKIPEEIKKPIKGFSIISIGIIQQKIWQWQHNRKEAKRAAKRLKRKK